MRYLNWDVLLFPSDSRTPIQEFDTKCHVITDPGSSGSQGSIAIHDPFLDTFDSMVKLPTLTCFVSSLTHNQPFRVSIHSWERPQASSVLQAYRAAEECIMFQARVYIDGVQHASRTFQEENLWPEVIDSRSVLNVPYDHKSNSDDQEHYNHEDKKVLRFPRFHEEILQQAHWDAGEPMGRVRIIISEGVMRETSPPGPQRFTFDRLRDVIAFSFQHAPKHILEYSGIAWPNAGMFDRPLREIHRREPILQRIPAASGHELHSHSPRKPRIGLINRHGMAVASPAYPIGTHHGGRTAFERPKVTQSAGIVSTGDPFMGSSSAPIHQWRSQLRESSQDSSMVDYISNKTSESHANTDMSGVSFPKKDFRKHMNEAAVDEIIQALSPAKKDLLFNALSPIRLSSASIEGPSSTPALARSKKADSSTVECFKETRGVAQLPLAGFYGMRRAPISPPSGRSVAERRSSEAGLEVNHSGRFTYGESDHVDSALLLQRPRSRPADSQAAGQQKRAGGIFTIFGQRSRSDSGSKRLRVVSPSTSEVATPERLTLAQGASSAIKDKVARVAAQDSN